MLNIPRPRGLDRFRVILDVRRNYAEAYHQLFQDYGDVFTIDSPLKAIFLFKPKHVRYVLKDNFHNFRKSDLYREVTPVIGKGLITSEGELWRKQRRVVAPEFHMKRIQHFVSDIVKNAMDLCREWEKVAESQNRKTGKPFHDISADMMKVTFNVVGDALFGSELREEATVVRESMQTFTRYATRKMLSPIKLPLSVPTPGNLEARKAIFRLRDVVSRMIAKRLEEERDGTDRIDVLSRLIAASRESSENQMDQAQLVDEIATLVLAGHETTSHVLTWVWYLLSENPHVQEKLDQELHTVLGGKIPQFEDIPKLKYTRMILKEAMRLYPPVPTLSRAPLEEDEIDGIPLLKDRMVQICPYVTHRHPEYWKNPEQFDPERFEEKKESEIEEGSYIPFLYGPRACAGEHLAMTEGTLLLAILASRFKVKVDSSRPVLSEAHLTLKPKGGLFAQIERKL